MGAGQGQAESSGGSAGSAGAPVSGHAGAVGKGGGRLMRWKCEEHMEIGKWKQENCEEKILTHAAHEWGPRRIERLRWTRHEREKSKVKARTLKTEGCGTPLSPSAN